MKSPLWMLLKLPVCKRRLGGADNYANFSILEVQDGSESNNTVSFSFKGYFGLGDLKAETWILNPIQAEVDSVSDKNLAKDDLIDLRTKEILQNELILKRLGKFWCALTQANLV